MLKDSPVGFFDSGVGGLSVYSKFREALPSENTIYFGDLKNLPYGNKSKEELIVFAKNILDFFKSKNVKLLNIVWFDKSDVGKIWHSTPTLERIGNATVKEHLPTQEISWIVKIFLYAI